MKIFVDSSVIIEYLKGTQTELLEWFVEENFELYINSIVLSESLFHFLALKGQKSPLTLKVNGEISKCLGESNLSDFLQRFTFIPDGAYVTSEVPLLMVKYNLLPNDAIILANCIHFQFQYLASFDTNDFQSVCGEENINLISSLEIAKQTIKLG